MFGMLAVIGALGLAIMSVLAGSFWIYIYLVAREVNEFLALFVSFAAVFVFMIAVGLIGAVLTDD